MDLKGEVLADSVASVPVHFLPGGGAEQDPADWWQALIHACRDALQKAGPLQVRAISVSSQWSGTVAVDRSGRALGRALIWMDARGAPLIEQVCGGWPSFEGYGLYRLAYWIYKTGGVPGKSGKDPLAHILYLKATAPGLYRQAATFFEPKDYLIFRLTGKRLAGFDSIALHWVTDNRNIDKIDYDRRLLSWAGVEREKLPDLVAPTSIAGDLLDECARELGLSGSIPVVMGTPDLQAAAVGSGAVLDFETHFCLGTSSWLTCHVPFKKTDILRNMASLPSALPGRYLIANEQETAGYSLQFLKENIFFCDDGLTVQNDKAMEQMLDRAARVPVRADGPLFFPWLYGERTPVEDSQLRGAFFNIAATTRRPDLIRATLEGVAFNARWLSLAVERFCSRKLKAINAIGGGARSPLWCQILASVLGCPVHQMEDPHHAGPRGAAYLALLALGAIRVGEIKNLARVQQTFYPEEQDQRIYEQKYRYFMEFYKKNRDLFHKMNPVIKVQE
ncbi:MAG: xylulose kinase [Spirochaetales bacterium]|nr:xylulose kinase [Spirochaetales bacterium]